MHKRNFNMKFRQTGVFEWTLYPVQGCLSWVARIAQIVMKAAPTLPPSALLPPRKASAHIIGTQRKAFCKSLHRLIAVRNENDEGVGWRGISFRRTRLS